MRRLAAVAVAVGLIGAAQVGAWGGEGHRLILDRAIQLLPTRFASRLSYMPAAPRPVFDTRDAMFEARASGAALVDGLLEADRRAAEGRTEYDDAYYDLLFAAARPVLERRMSEAITAVAGVILGAWEEAGRPDLTTTPPRPAQNIRGRDAR